MRKADDAFASMDSAMTRVDDFVPGLANGRVDELLGKVQSLRELAESFNKKSATVMEEGRRSLLDLSEAAVKMTRKLDPQTPAAASPPPPRKPKRQ
jgi:phospholipid/cholesterol/gamma-HCH transport system substrate-binding protein